MLDVTVGTGNAKRAQYSLSSDGPNGRVKTAQATPTDRVAAHEGFDVYQMLKMKRDPTMYWRPMKNGWPAPSRKSTFMKKSGSPAGTER